VEVGDDVENQLKEKYLEATKLTLLKKVRKLREKDRGCVHRLGSGEVPHRRLGTIVGVAIHKGPMAKVNYRNMVSDRHNE